MKSEQIHRQNTIITVTGRILGGLVFAECIALIIILGTILLD